jgi:predicted MFS family arabinose efflux permease
MTTHTSQLTTHRPIRRKFIISGLVLLILALGFNALLSLSALEKLYLQSVSSKYTAIGKTLQRNLENSLRFGKKIERFFGIEQLLEETRRNLLRKIDPESPAGNEISVSVSDYDISVSLSMPDGTLRYSTDKNRIGTKLPEQLLIPGKSGYRRSNEKYIISQPIYNGLEKEQAFIIIAFGKKQVGKFLKAAFIRNIKIIGVIFASSAILLVFAFNIIIPAGPNPHPLPKLKIYLPLLLIIGISQILFNVLNSGGFKNYYLEISKEKTSVLAMLLKEDIEYYLSKGIRIHKLVKMDERMGELIAAAPELDSMIVADRNGHPLYIATQKGVIDLQKTDQSQKTALSSLFCGEMPEKINPEYRFTLKILKNDQAEGYISAESYQGFIFANISKQVLFTKLKEITLDSGTVLVISFLFFAELLILVFQFIQKQTDNLTESPAISWQAMRPAAFLFLIAYSIASSFIPLHMENLYNPVFGLSKDIVMGLPLSVRNFCAGIAIIISGTWIDRRGWHEPFLAGLSLISAGFLYCWAAPSAIHFILAMGVAGLGYGLSLMASQGFVIAHTSAENKTQGLSQLFAGVYAGVICGSSAGGMLAERVGYRPVFLTGSLIALSVIAYTFLFMRSAIQKPEIQKVAKRARAGISSVFQFLFDRSVFSVILFSTIAAEIAGVGFINYFSPVYLSRLGASESAIGRVFMINGLCFIYIAPFLSKYADASENKKAYIIIGGILGGLAFVSFYFSVSFLRGMIATSLTVLLIGISAAFADSSRSSYVLKLQAAQELGAGKAMGVLSSSARIGQVLGPVVFGGFMATAGMNKGILFLGAAYLLLTFLFFVIARKDRELKIED